MTNDELDKIMHGDPDAPKPRGVLDMRRLRETKILKASGFDVPFSGGPIPQWVKDGKR